MIQAWFQHSKIDETFRKVTTKRVRPNSWLKRVCALFHIPRDVRRIFASSSSRINVQLWSFPGLKLLSLRWCSTFEGSLCWKIVQVTRINFWSFFVAEALKVWLGRDFSSFRERFKLLDWGEKIFLTYLLIYFLLVYIQWLSGSASPVLT